MTYMLWTRNDTISPLTLQIYEMLKGHFEQKGSEQP
jgi:hypothetical protein